MQPPFFVKWNNMVHIWFNLEKIMFIPIKKVVIYMMTSRMQSYCKLHLLPLLLHYLETLSFPQYSLLNLFFHRREIAINVSTLFFIMVNMVFSNDKHGI